MGTYHNNVYRENRQILQTLIDNNIITAADQRTPILALKAIQTAIENKEHHQHDRNKKSAKMATNSAAMTTTKSSTKSPWRQFYKHIIKYMDSLHAEPCKPQMKIDTFIHAIKHSFPSPTMDLEKHKTSTKQTQTTADRSKHAAQRTHPTATLTLPITQNQKVTVQTCLPRPSKSSADHKHKVQPGDQTFAHPCSKPHKEQQQDQSYQHFDTPAKTKHFYMTRHPNYCESNQYYLHNKDVLQHLHTISVQEKHHFYLLHHHQYKKFQLQQPLQTIHYKTISIQQWKSNLHKTFTILQQIVQPIHSKTITITT